jgi:hypothetical protein
MVQTVSLQGGVIRAHLRDPEFCEDHAELYGD